MEDSRATVSREDVAEREQGRGLAIVKGYTATYPLIKVFLSDKNILNYS